MIFVILLVVGLLTIIAGMMPKTSRYSSYELSRRKKLRSPDSKPTLDERRYQTHSDIITWLYIDQMVLYIVLLILLVGEFGWVNGILLAIIGLIVYRLLSRVKFISKFSQSIYDRVETKVIFLAEKLRPITKLLRQPVIESTTEIASRQELKHIIQKSGTLTTKDEQLLLQNAFDFKDKLVVDYMTPASVIDTVAFDELLGPLMLDALHKTGHSHFPVTENDINHVVGLLHIQDLLVIKNQKSAKVSDVMSRNIYYIHQDQTLMHALSALIKTKQQVFIVVNRYRETVGLISLEDVIEALLGQQIVDQFDKHDDLRAVAARNPRHNNLPSQGSDV